MARSGVGFFNHFQDEPEGLEGVTGGGGISGWLEESGGGKIDSRV